MPRPFFMRALCGRFGSVVDSAPPYQLWASFPATPELTASYPYQAILNVSPVEKYLVISTAAFYKSGTNIAAAGGVSFRIYFYTGSSWLYDSAVTSFTIGNSILEANNDIYTSSDLTTVHFAKTTA